MTSARSSDPQRIAAVVRAHSEELLQRWMDRVRRDPAVPESSRLPEPELRDHVPLLLEHIAALLESCGGEDGERAGRELGRDGASTEHAEDRFERDYDVSAALRELSHLRLAMFDLFDAHRTQPGVESLRVLAAALDESMANAAVEIQRRTHDTLQREAEHRERFIAVLAHDLRQPLQSILFSATALAGSADLADHDRRAAVRAKRAAERMTSLVDDVLDLARSQHGRGIPVSRREADLSEIVSHAIDETSAANPGARIELVSDGDLRGTWDPDRLSQIVANLLGNAIKHGAADVPVRVTAREEERGVSLRIENDNRHGPIPPELRAVLFQPFERGVGPARGLGLGLYIACQIAQAHGGSIEVESDEQKTAFTLRLPRSPPPPRAGDE